MQREFAHDEPLTVCLGVTPKECYSTFRDMVRKSAEDGFSYIAHDENLDCVCGVRLNAVAKPRKYLSGDEIRLLEDQGKMRHILHVLELCESQLFLHVPPDSRVFKFDIVSVAKSYQNRHIAKELVDLTMKRIAQEPVESRFTHMMTIATSYKTQNLYENQRKFRVLYELPLKDFVSFDGSKPFRDINVALNPSVKLLAKEADNK